MNMDKVKKHRHIIGNGANIRTPKPKTRVMTFRIPLAEYMAYRNHCINNGKTMTQDTRKAVMDALSEAGQNQ